jgi:hypothetical protein
MHASGGDSGGDSGAGGSRGWDGSGAPSPRNTPMDTGLNTMAFRDQIMAQERRLCRQAMVARRRKRPGTTSTSIATKNTTTFGVRGHQEDSHLDRLEKLGRKRPGPADYIKPPLHSIGGKFNLSNAKSDVDWLCYRASRQPGPGAYDIKPPKMHGGKFSTAFPKSDVDWLIYYASTKPGVGEYNLDEAFHRYVGPGPRTQLSAIDRGLYDKPSVYRATKLPRKISRKMISVTKRVHQSRKRWRSYGRFAPGNPRRQAEDRVESSKTLSAEVSELRKMLGRNSNFDVSQPQFHTNSVVFSGDGESEAAVGGGSTLGAINTRASVSTLQSNTMSRSKFPPGSLFRHASASVILAPPEWDEMGQKNHALERKNNAERTDDGLIMHPSSQRQGGAGACWAKTSAGLVFVAHDDPRYRPDKVAYKHREVRQVVRVAPLKVPRL